MLGLAMLCLFVSATGFRFDDFGEAGPFVLLGSTREHNSAVRLTPAQRQLAGALWYGEKQPVAVGFRTEFQFRITNPGGLGNGADGFAFVIQNKGTEQIAGRGGSGGFAPGDGFGIPDAPGIPEGVAVFFDTHRNGDEPSDNYVGVYSNGRLDQMRWPPARLAVSGSRLKVRLKDGRVHTARVEYQRPRLSVFLDGERIIATAVDLSPVADGNGRAWIGFTGSTGSGYENHDLLSWRFAGEEVASDLYDVSSSISYHLADCMEGRNLCTPAKAMSEQRSASEWRVTLPAHLTWPVSLPARQIEIVTAQGMVCYGRDAQAGCEEGTAAVRQKQQDGRVWLSTARDGVEGQGFVELLVRVR